MAGKGSPRPSPIDLGSVADSISNSPQGKADATGFPSSGILSAEDLKSSLGEALAGGPDVYGTNGGDKGLGIDPTTVFPSSGIIGADELAKSIPMGKQAIASMPEPAIAAHLDTTNLSAPEKLALLKQLKSSNATSDVNGISLASMTPIERKNLYNSLLNQNTIPDWAKGTPLEDINNFGANLGGMKPATNSLDAGVQGWGNSADGFWRDEGTALVSTISDIAHGKVRSLDDLINTYSAHRDLSREAYKNTQNNFPLSSFAGEIAGGLSLPNPVKGMTVAEQLLPSTETLMPRLRASGKVGLAYGAIFGSGASEADLTKGEFLPFFKDTATGMGLGAIAAMSAEATLGSISRAGRKSFLVGDEGKQAAAGVLATNTGSTRISGKMLDKLDRGDLKNLSSSISALEEENVINLRPYSITDPSPKTFGTGVMKNVREQWNDVTSFYLNGKPIDYGEVQSRLGSVISDRSQQLDDLLLTAQKAKGGSYSLLDIVGTPEKAKSMQRFVQFVANTAEKSENFNTAQQAESLAEIMSDPKASTWDLPMIRQLRQYVGMASKFGNDTDMARISPSITTSRGLYNSVDSFLRKEVGVNSPENLAQFKFLNKRLSDLLLGQDLTDLGELAANEVKINNPAYYKALSSNNSAGVPGLLNAFTQSQPGNIMSSGIRALGNAAVPFARVGASVANQPQLTSMWATKIFQSMQGGKLKSNNDKQLALHYIEVNGKLTPKEKFVQQQKVKTEGTFDLSNIPENIRNKAIDQPR